MVKVKEKPADNIRVCKSNRNDGINNINAYNHVAIPEYILGVSSAVAIDSTRNIRGGFWQWSESYLGV